MSIPDSVQEIGDEAFQKCYELASVRFGQAVTNIGKSAFAYCGALDGIVLPDALALCGA